MHPIFIEEWGLAVWSTNIGAQKIDGTIFKTYEIVVAVFSVIDWADRVRFFEKTFLMANVSPNMVFGIFFFIPNSANINFLKKKLWWRSYIIEKALFTTKRVELVEKKEFTTAALNLEYETFVIYIVFLDNPSNN